jgi:YbbR domain-containing protein
VRALGFVVRNWPLKVGAISLSVILYVAMVVLQNTAAWPGSVAIDLVNQPAGSYLIDPKPIPAVSGIRYLAPADVPVSQSSFRATADLSKARVSESDSSLVRVQLVADDPRIQIIDYQPQQISVRLDPVVHKRVSVLVRTTTPPAGLEPGTPVLDTDTVDVYGASSIVRRVAYARAEVRIDESGLDINEDVDLVARDAADAVVADVTFDPRTVHVQIQVGSQLRSETVPVSPTIIGVPASGYFLESVEVQPLVISVQGQADALALLKGAVRTKPISVAGATRDITVNATLDLPKGVSAGATTSVAVTIRLISPSSTRSVAIGVVPDGARADRIYSLSTPNVIVTLSGATASLNAFDTSALTGRVDVSSLDIGVHTVTISVFVPAGINVIVITPARITVTITTAPTPSPSV